MQTRHWVCQQVLVDAVLCSMSSLGRHLLPIMFWQSFHVTHVLPTINCRIFVVTSPVRKLFGNVAMHFVRVWLFRCKCNNIAHAVSEMQLGGVSGTTPRRRSNFKPNKTSDGVSLISYYACVIISWRDWRNNLAERCKTGLRVLRARSLGGREGLHGYDTFSVWANQIIKNCRAGAVILDYPFCLGNYVLSQCFLSTCSCQVFFLNVSSSTVSFPLFCSSCTKHKMDAPWGTLGCQLCLANYFLSVLSQQCFIVKAFL
jgi:hypothetical protein